MLAEHDAVKATAAMAKQTQVAEQMLGNTEVELSRTRFVRFHVSLAEACDTEKVPHERG